MLTSFLRAGEDQIAVTPKVASQTLYKRFGKPVEFDPERTTHMLVRHPQDRLVSCWKYFTQIHKSYIPELIRADRTATPEHYAFLSEATPFERWCELAFSLTGEISQHWTPQSVLHPNWKEFKIYPIEALGGAKKNATQRKGWPHYYTIEFGAKMRKLYATDLEMYTIAKEAWDGREASIFKGP